MNGVLDTTANETSATVPNYTSPLNVGILHLGSTVSFAGSIDEVRFLRRAMSAAEVTALVEQTATHTPLVAAGTAPTPQTNTAATLNGSVTVIAGAAPTAAWSKVSGPGSVTFGNAAQAATTATFSQAGSYVLRLTGTNANGETFATLPVTVALNPAIFSDWQSIHWPGVTNPAIIGSTADSNNDGESNLMEFATAQNPNANTQSTPALTKNGTTMEFIYTKSKTATDVTYEVEWSDDLSAWSSAGVTSSLLTDGSTTQQIKALVPAGVNRRFVHLKVSRP